VIEGLAPANGVNQKGVKTNQPDPGLKAAELHHQKGLTQEQLPERCEVSARTIQPIESEEVDPGAYNNSFCANRYTTANGFDCSFGRRRCFSSAGIEWHCSPAGTHTMTSATTRSLPAM
jgi:DNA-binding XRE family transcriptional regulator